MLVTPAGDADLATAPCLRKALRQATEQGRRRVIVDLDELTFMDATTLSALVEARLCLSAAGGELRVRSRRHHIRRLMSLTGLDGMLDHQG